MGDGNGKWDGVTAGDGPEACQLPADQPPAVSQEQFLAGSWKLKSWQLSSFGADLAPTSPFPISHPISHQALGPAPRSASLPSRIHRWPIRPGRWQRGLRTGPRRRCFARPAAGTLVGWDRVSNAWQHFARAEYESPDHDGKGQHVRV